MALWLDQGVVSVLISLASDISSIEGQQILNCFIDLDGVLGARVELYCSTAGTFAQLRNKLRK